MEGVEFDSQGWYGGGELGFWGSEMEKMKLNY